MLYLLFIAAIVVGDQFFKNWIVSNVALYGTRDLLPGIVRLTFVKNTGAAFSILSRHTWILSAVSAVAALALLVYLFLSHHKTPAKLCIAAVIGGAIGNCIDRIRLGFVVDMFDLQFMDFAVFNVADIFITCGGILFCLFYLLESRKKSPQLTGRRMPELDRLSGTTPPEDDTSSSED